MPPPAVLSQIPRKGEVMARLKTPTWSSAGFGRFRGAASDDSGFSLLESVIAFGIFMIVLVSVSSMLVSAGRLTTTTRDRTAAANLAAEQIELMREQNANGQGVNTGGPILLRGITYTVAVSAFPAFNGACASGSSRQVSVTVSWNGGDGQHATRDDTVIAC